MPIKVTIDSREKKPWAFDPSLVTASVNTLKTGDYSLEGDAGFAIERKSLDDFLNTISSGWERFIREIYRMADWPARVIIVESNFLDCCFSYNTKLEPPKHQHHKLSPSFISMRIAELTMVNVSVIFAGVPELAAGLAYHILKQRAKSWKN